MMSLTEPEAQALGAIADGLAGSDPRLAGKYVIIGAGRTYALYAHLAPESVAVRRGQQVRARQVIGRVGHTGNSTAPRLHFQLMDSADPLTARGIPCAFAEYLIRRAGSGSAFRVASPAGSSVSVPSRRLPRRGGGLWLAGSRRMASFGESWNCLLGAAGAFVVALAARRSWFCCHQLFAVLLRFGRRRTGLAELAELGRGAFLDARLRLLRHVAGRLCVGLQPGRAGVGRGAVGG